MNYYDRSLDALMHAYGRYNVTFDHGDGIHLYDVNQKEYIDFFSGIGVNSFGYNYPAYVEAMEKSNGTNSIAAIVSLIDDAAKKN